MFQETSDTAPGEEAARAPSFPPSPAPAGPNLRLLLTAGGVLIGFGFGYFLAFQSLSGFERIAHWMFWESPFEFSGWLFESKTFWKIFTVSSLGALGGGIAGRSIAQRTH